MTETLSDNQIYGTKVNIDCSIYIIQPLDPHRSDNKLVVKRVLAITWVKTKSNKTFLHFLPKVLPYLMIFQRGAQ